MSGVAFINHAAGQAEEWIGEIQDDLNLQQRQSAYAALRAVLHHLRDRLPIAECTDLSAQLPTLVRGIFFEGWTPAQDRKPVRSKQEFIDNVMHTLGEHREVHAENAIRSVFALLDRKISHGEINNVIANFPVEMRELWPEKAVDRLGSDRNR